MTVSKRLGRKKAKWLTFVVYDALGMLVFQDMAFFEYAVIVKPTSSKDPS
jgi:hypothetical protein